MNQGVMFRPNWLQSLDTQFVFAATVQKLDQQPQDGYGRRIGNWSTLAGMDDIPCKMAVASVGAANRERAELQALDRIDRMRHITLIGNWSGITELHRVLVCLLDPATVGEATVGEDTLVGGETWVLQIVTAQQDSHQQTTRLLATMQEPG